MGERRGLYKYANLAPPPSNTLPCSNIELGDPESSPSLSWLGPGLPCWTTDETSTPMKLGPGGGSTRATPLGPGTDSGTIVAIFDTALDTVTPVSAPAVATEPVTVAAPDIVSVITDTKRNGPMTRLVDGDPVGELHAVLGYLFNNSLPFNRGAGVGGARHGTGGGRQLKSRGCGRGRLRPVNSPTAPVAVVHGNVASGGGGGGALNSPGSTGALNLAGTSLPLDEYQLAPLCLYPAPLGLLSPRP